MGEKPQQVELVISPEAIAGFMGMLKTLITQRHDPLPAEPAQALTPYDLGLAPWTFHDPRQKVDVMAYVDDRNQVRHVPTTRATEVPNTWQRVWLQPRQ